MSRQTNKPVIFLAFANDRQAHGSFLRNLGQEAEQLRAALTSAEKASLCQVEIRSSVSAETILNVFNDSAYKKRVALFHYAGHAEDYALLLESATGEQTVADGRGLAAFLRQQTGLQLVFLNACSTQAQVAGLLDAGIAAVIATASAIDDELATGFARHFYTGLAGGDSIRTAFEKAQAALQFVHSDLSRHLSLVADSPDDHATAGLPWALYLRNGTEEIAAWNLPSAANDPLFGLPPLPAMDLPAKPFRDLNWFRRADAPIFFGRGHQIRQLYTIVTDAQAAPLVLFYGQSGVGKSSLLDAGLLPRLEQTQRVLYLRRNQQQGLLGTLFAHLPGTAITAVDKAFTPVLAAWRAVEQETNQPLTLILDQVEEHFTRPNQAIPNELEQFLQALLALFADRTQRPQGKLILSFRKEWLAELEKRLDECALPYSKIFLERLDEAGVIEAISGVARTPALQQHYGLTLENGLAAEIAHDLLKDREAPIAPMLQILLTRLWEEATQRNRSQPRFDRLLYDQLRRTGLKLPEFLNRQLTLLQEQQPDAVNSGLALDLLSFHTTPLGTAEQRDFATLQATYHHRTGILSELVRSFQNLYLLVDPSADQADTQQKSRLAHDTLAPLVRARFDESDLPGQRAQRILETRAVEWDDDTDNRQSTSLDRQDLAVVEQGAAGMRIWTAAEQRLVAASRQREVIRRRNLRIWQGIGLVAILLIVATAWMALLQRNRALTRESEANAATELAQQRERQAKVAELVAQTQSLLQGNDVDKSPNLPLMLARRAILTTLTADHYVTAEAEANLSSAIAQAPPWIRTIPPQRHSAPVMALDLSADGQTLLSASSDLTARLWNLHNGTEIQRFVGHNGPVWSARFSPDGNQIVTASVDGTVRLWEAASGQELRQMHGHVGTVWSAIYSVDGLSLFSAGEDHSVRMWDVKTGQHLRQFVGHSGRVLAVATSPDGTRLASAGADHVIRLWEIATGEAQLVLDAPDAVVTALRFLQQGSWLISGDSQGMLRLWDTASGTELRAWQAHEGWIGGLAVSQDEARVATASPDAMIGLWEIASGKAISPSLGSHGGAVNAVIFTPDGQQLISGSDDQSIRRWDIASGNQLRFLPGHTAPVIRALYSHDGKFIVSADKDGTILLHDALAGNPLAALSHAGPLTSLDLSSDNRTIVSGGDQTIRLLDLISHTVIAQTQAHTDTILAVKFSPDNARLATAGSDNLACLWQLRPWQKINCLEHPNWVRALAFSPDSKTLFTSCDDGKLRAWDLTTLQNITTIELPTGYRYFTALAASPDGQQLATALDTDIALWDLPLTGQSRQTLLGHIGVVNAIVYGQDGKTLASAASDNSVRLWDLTTATEQMRLDGHEVSTQAGGLSTEGVTSVDFSPDGKTLVTSSTDNTVRFWDIRADRPDDLLDGVHSGQLASATVGRSGQYAVTAGYDDGQVVIWNLATEQPIRKFKIDSAQATFARLSPDETTLAAGFTDGFVRLWNLPDGQLLHEFPHAQWPWRLAFNPVGNRIAVASWDGTAYVWDIVSGQPILQLSANAERLWSVQFSHDGQRIVTAGEDRQVHVWDATRGAPLQSFSFETIDRVMTAIFSPDDQMILVGVDAIPFGSNAAQANNDPLAGDFALRLLDVNTGQQIRQFVGHTGAVTWADFAANGQTFVTASTDKTIRLWDAKSGLELRKIQQPTEIPTVFFLPDGQTLLAAGREGVAQILPTVEAMLRRAAALTQREPALFWRAEQSRYQIPATLPEP